jgi:hypothetical protein
MRLISSLVAAGIATLAISSSSSPATNPRGPAVSSSTQLGTWVNVTPAGVDLANDLSCGNFGTETVWADTANPGTLYTEFNCQGIWKSTDYGQTWTGPVNTGTNGSTVSSCAGGITGSANATAGRPATIYESCIRGSGIGFWKSTDGGVDWTNYSVVPPMPTTQDVYPATVDPYNPNHLLMTAHEQDYILQSTNGGRTWSRVTMAARMMGTMHNTGAIFFINTGNSTTTATTWLWLSQITGGAYGTWRTSDGGTSWTQVDTNEHPHGIAQVYQPDTSGVMYMAGMYSAHGNGVLRSTDYGQTWTHVGQATAETVVTGTPNNVYALFGWAIGAGSTVAPAFELAAQPGTGTWSMPSTPANMTQAGGTMAVVNDGTHYIIVDAGWNRGLWRYVEPAVISGVWNNVTPAGINLVDNLDCSNFGTKTVQADTSNPGVAYTLFFCQGIYKTTDYGQTWTGPINTGSNGKTVGDCAGTLRVVPNATPGGAATIFEACIRGGTYAATGLWKSTDNGVDWTQETVAHYSGPNGFYAPVVDPYDSKHLLMAGHETNVLFESADGGTTWTSPNVASGMVVSGGTLGISFINTGAASTTRTTWLGMAPLTGGTVGTWRTTNSGTSWTRVTNGEHGNGDVQTYQPDTSGKFYIAEQYASIGSGVLYSTDYGQTWTHEGVNEPEAIVFGNRNRVYAMYGWAPGAGTTVNPTLETAAAPGTDTWTSPGTPVSMSQGPAEAAVLNDGVHYIVLVANYNAGMWRYVQP